eukprot:snap_masked-scaffold_38-processed-gene-1.49-mRNA-1 protein AED:0.42 eAED:1.00 QI:0/-1/0/1/-1/1/1/0/74
MLVEMSVLSTTQKKRSRTAIVICATTRSWVLDRALLRRLKKKIYISLPCAETREKRFRKLVEGKRLNLDDRDIQ